MERVIKSHVFMDDRKDTHEPGRLQTPFLPCTSAAPTAEPAVAVPAGWAAARAGTPCRRGGCTCCCCCSGSSRGSALPAGQRKSALCQCHCVSADVQQWASHLRMDKEIIAQPGLQDRMSTLSAPTTMFLLIFPSLAVLPSLRGNHPEMLSKSSRYMEVWYTGQPPGTAQQRTHSPAHPYACVCQESRCWSLLCWVSRKLQAAGFYTGLVLVKNNNWTHANSFTGRNRSGTAEWLSDSTEQPDPQHSASLSLCRATALPAGHGHCCSSAHIYTGFGTTTQLSSKSAP